MSIRWQHVHFTQPSAAGTFQVLQIPAIPRIAHRIRRVHVDMHTPLAGDVGQIQWVFSHFLSNEDPSSAASTFLRDSQAAWLMGSIQSTQGGAHRQFRFDRDEDMLIAGPQHIGLSNGSGATIHVAFSVAYEDIPIQELAWTLLKTRTSFEED